MPHAHADPAPYRSTPTDWTFGKCWLVAWISSNAFIVTALLVLP